MGKKKNITEETLKPITKVNSRLDKELQELEVESTRRWGPQPVSLHETQIAAEAIPRRGRGEGEDKALPDLRVHRAQDDRLRQALGQAQGRAGRQVRPPLAISARKARQTA
jgi:hypothetical protein